MVLLLVAVVGYAGFLVWVPIKSYNAMPKVADAPAGSRPASGAGSNYLLVGSDSRAGLTAEQEAELSTGSESDDPGQRTDSIMLLHRSSSGKSSLISIPRDSYVEIPGYGANKINAAFAFGGPALLVETVEGATGLRIDGYLEIGFGGFASVVDALGGVEICVPFPMDDPRAGINLQEGCQTLNGATALGYVRARYSDPRGDIGRAERQRQFLSAIMQKSVSPKTILDPFQYYAVVMAPSQGLALGEDTSLYETAQIFLTMRAMSNGDGLSLVVPISSTSFQTTNAGVAVKWDTERATALFDALRDDDPLTEAPAGTDGAPSQG